MLKHYIITGLRVLLRHKTYSLINIAGLAIGLASFIFIALFIMDELSYDDFHDQSERIYRVNRLYNSNNVNEDASTCSFPMAPALQLDYPDMVESVCRFFDFQVSKVFIEFRKDSNNIVEFNESSFYLADSTIFEIFTFPFLKGNPKTALNDPNSLVLTKSAALRYFGQEDPIGKTLWLEEGLPFSVTGVLDDLPEQTHFDFDILGSMSTFRQLGGGNLPQTWVWNPCWTYVLLSPEISPELLENNLPEFYLNHYPDLADQDVVLYLQALEDIHLKSHHAYEMHPNGNSIYVYILSSIAVIVLILACINFMNLTTANSASRTKEIGVRKVFGGSRKTLALQFIGESMLMSFTALLIASTLIEILLPAFNDFTGKNIPHNFIFQPVSLLSGLALSILVGLLAGTYPAFFLSSFKPITILKGIYKDRSGGSLVRKILITIQFSFSIILIIGTLIVYSQLQYLRDADLGFKKDQIILIPSVNQVSINYETFRENLLKYPDIKYVTAMEDILGEKHNTRQLSFEGLRSDQIFWFPMFMVRYDFIETFDIEVVEGRSFSRKFPSDTSNAIMINEAMVRDMGWTNQEAIGKSIRSDGNERVIGVFKDFHILSLHSPINSFIIDMLRNPREAAALTRYIAVRVNTSNFTNILEILEKEWNELAGNRPFEYEIFNEELDDMYNDEERFGKFSVMLTLLALFIACLGMVGLTSYLAEQKTKEIGVRRAMGASIVDIFKMLSGEFLRIILFSNLIAWPLAYFISQYWLDGFTKHISLNIILYFTASIFLLIITLIIISYRAIISSLKNPAVTLRYE